MLYFLITIIYLIIFSFFSGSMKSTIVSIGVYSDPAAMGMFLMVQGASGNDILCAIGIVTLVLVPCFSLVHIGIDRLVVMVMSTMLSGIVTALLVVAISSNKVEGMAVELYPLYP